MMKGLILCAGIGTRLQPFSFNHPKTLLPVVNKPVLVYGIERLISAGITEIGIVINNSQQQIMVDTIGYGERWGVKLEFIIQQKPLGIADAVRCSESFIGGDCFILLLGDNLFEDPLDELRSTVEKKLARACIRLVEVENPQDFGVAEIENGVIIRLEEKPAVPKSKLAVVGAYAFDESIFLAIRSIMPSRRGEYEITDAIQWLIERGFEVSYTITKHHYSDVGSVNRWLEANRWVMELAAGGQSVIAPDVHLRGCILHPPVVIDANCVLEDCEIGPYVSIQSGVRMKDCNIASSIVLKGANLSGIPHVIRDSVFGEDVVVTGGTGNAAYKRYILGDKSVLGNS
jgi:glucose-1-phosphate thymidylyltransferase